MKIDKERVGGLKGKEINFVLTLHNKWLVNDLGDEVSQVYPVVSINVLRTWERKKEEITGREKALELRILEIIDELEYPSRNDVYSILGGKKDRFLRILKGTTESGKLVELPLPDDHHKRSFGRKTYLMRVKL
jgi:hypothetical protein